MREAAPNPPPGPERDGLVAINQLRIRAFEDAMTTALSEYLKRVGGVVRARVRGPKVRRGTKWWGESATLAHTAPVPTGMEYKAVDAGAAVPDRLVGEIEDAVRPVALRVARDAAADTARRLGYDVPDTIGDGMFAVDEQAVADAVEQAIAEMLGAASRHAADLRKAVLDADATAETLDEMLDRIEQAHERGGKWMLLRGRDLAHALANRSALEQARSLGVRTAQWLSRRDGRVRPTHVQADGQVRELFEPYRVGRWNLLHPGDPADLPESAQEVHNCRCNLLFARPDADVREALRLISDRLDRAESTLAAARRLLRRAAAVTPGPVPVGVPAGMLAAGATAAALTTTEPVLGFRLLDAALTAVPGQRLALPATIVLGLLAAQATAGTVPLTVAIPAGTALVVVGGSIMLAQGTELEVLAAGPNGVEARPVSP